MKKGSNREGNHSSTPLRFIALSFLLLIMLCSAYSNTFSSPPVLDDFHTFIEEPLVRIQDWNLSNLALLSHTKFGWSRYIPILTLSFDLWISKGELFYFHLTNLIIHIFVSISIIFLVYNLCKAWERKNSSIQSLPAGSFGIIVGAIWALHPLQASAVTYIVQRMTAFSALFTCLAVALYISGRLAATRGDHSNWKTFLYFFLSFLSMFLGLLSKENSAMTPVLIVMIEAWFFQPDLFHRTLIFARKRRVLVTVICVLILSVIAHYISSAVIPGYRSRHFTLMERLMTQPRVIGWYVSVLFWPIPSRLSLEHDVIISTGLLNPPTTIVFILAVVFTCFWSFSRRQKYPMITYGIVWFGLNMVIESSIIPLELLFEHRMYLPSVGLIMSIVSFFYYIIQNRISAFKYAESYRVVWCSFLILCSILSLLTFQRNCIWESTETLALDNAMKAPYHPRSHANLSTTYLRKGRYKEAIDEAKKAIDLGREHFEQYFIAGSNIVAAYLSLGDNQKAVEEGERLLKEKPQGHLDVSGLPAFYLNVARSQQYLGDLKGAFASVLQALWTLQNTPGKSGDMKRTGLTALSALLQQSKEEDIDLDGDGKPDPGESTEMFWIAQQFIKIGEREIAKELLLKGAKDPTDRRSAEFLEVLTKEENLNRIQEEKKDFKSKYVLRPLSPFNMCMAMAFLLQNHASETPLHPFGGLLLGAAEWLNPNSADVHLLKGWHHFSRRETPQAIEAAKKALRIDPSYARAWLGMALFLTDEGKTEEALASFEKTLALYPAHPERLKIIGLMTDLRGELSRVGQAGGVDSSAFRLSKE